MGQGWSRSGVNRRGFFPVEFFALIQKTAWIGGGLEVFWWTCGVFGR
jgi:hypothetical protein